ncbi:MAG: PAS domain S-box protein [Deltaproteobacteria bacterium]|nr:PAS domain S-box protein [Deltaproteobacteria bacterium]
METAHIYHRLLDSSLLAKFYKNSATAEDRFLRLVFTLFLLPGILLLTLFGCLNALDGATVESGLNFGAALFFSGLLYSQRYVQRAVHLCRISLLALAVLFYYISMVGGASGFKVLWIYLFPLAVFFILGNLEGLAWSLSFFAGLVFLLSDLNTQIPAYRYPDDFRLRIHWVYLTIVVMMFMYETVRRFYQEGLHQKQRQLIDEKQKLAEANTTIMATTHHIREREATLNSIFRAAPAGICLVKNGVIEKVNAQLSRMLGYREEALVSRSMATLFTDADAHARFERDLHPMDHRSGIARVECAWQHSSSKALTVLACATRVDASRPEDGMIIVSLDMTERKNAERELRRSEEKYRLLVDNAHDGIFIVQDEKIRFANPRAQTYFGFDDNASLNAPLIDFIHPQDRDMVMTRHRKRIAGQDAPNQYAFRIVNTHAQTLWLELNAVHIDWNDRPAVICFCHDLTQTKSLENQLMQAQKMQAIGTLAGGIAHDFNNMLQAIIGYTEISMKAAPDDEMLCRRLNRVLEAGNRARELIGQILTFSRQQKEEQRPVTISSIVKEVLKLIRVSTPSTITFIETIDDDAGTVMADPTRIHQLVMNLCTNAAQAMKATGGKLAVTLKPFQVDDSLKRKDIDLLPGAYVQLKISDTGCGMDSRTVARIFEPYFSTKKRGEGTGLGLAVVHGIVKNLNGSIVVYSEPNEGSTFNVFIPRVDAGTVDMLSQATACPGGSETILLVDDEEIVMDISREILESLGYTVVGRVSSIEAYNAFCASPERFDAVVTDYTMPEMTGVALAKAISALRSDIPIVMCTGFSAALTGPKLQGAGIDTLLNKPVLTHELAAALRSLLDRQKEWSF